MVAKESLKNIILEGTTPFKVHVNFDIPLFEGHIDADALDKWLNLLEGYYSVQFFFDGENITFTLLKSLPHVRYWWEGYWERYITDESTLFGREPTWAKFVDSLKEEFYPIRNYDEQYMRWKLCVRKEIGRCRRTLTYFIPYAQIWVSKTLRGTWF